MNAISAPVRAVFHSRNTALATLAIFALLLIVYVFFDLREGGRSSSLTTTQLGTPAFYIEAFGAWFVFGALILDVALAVASAILIAASIVIYRGKSSKAGRCVQPEPALR